MPYSDQEMEEIAHNPVRLRAWWWRMAMHHQKLAREKRAMSHNTGTHHPVTNYRPQFEEGRDMADWATVLESLSGIILDDLEAFVRSTLEPAHCTCRPDANGKHSP